MSAHEVLCSEQMASGGSRNAASGIACGMAPDRYTTRFDDAAAFTIAAFRTHARKASGVPYITHLFAVCALVGEYGGDEDQMIAALLHDWLEDVPGAERSLLEARFGARVARLVVALTDSAAPEPGGTKPPWRGRKEQYLTHLRIAPHELKLISCADKLHNCQTIRADHSLLGNRVYDRFTGKQEGTLWYYRAVREALAEGWQNPILDRLDAEVHALIEASRAQH